MSSAWSRFVVLIFVLLNLGLLHGQNQNFVIQPKNNSPFSRFGLGDPVDQFFAAPGAMGGLSAAFNDPYHLNLLNPASLAYLRATAFEVGLYGKYAGLKGRDEQEDVWSGNLNYLALGFPLVNPVNRALDRKESPWDFGMGFALAPYTLVGYNIETKLVDPDVEVTTNSLKGTGGTYRLTWGNGVRYKNFSIGASFGYTFGKMTNSRRVVFDSLQSSYATELLDETSVSGWTWNTGVQYVHNFKKPDPQGVPQLSGRRLILGAFGNSGGNVNTLGSRLYQRDNSRYTDIDTILIENQIKGKLTLPAEFSFGATYERINKLRLGIEYSLGAWSKYRSDARPDERLSNAWRVAVGGEFIPDIQSYNRYFERVRYRAGLFYGTDPRSIEGEQLNKYGIAFGIGLPIVMPRQQPSYVNISFEAGRFGVSGVLSETYMKTTVGFTLNDNSWFFKRKFN